MSRERGNYALLAALALRDDGAALAVDAFFAAGFAFAGAAFPVTAFLAESRLLDAVVFLAAAGFRPAGAFLISAFLAGAALALVVVDFAAGVDLVVAALDAGAFFAGVTFVVDFVVDFVEVGFFATTGFFAVTLAALAGAALGLATALGAFGSGLFSLVARGSGAREALGGSLTRPEGPLGRTNTPFSAPVVMALLS